MIRNIYVYCEGSTEEAFVNRVLAPYLAYSQIYCTPIVCKSGGKHQKTYRGGILSYEKIKHELILLCKQHQHEAVTTLLDFYGMPTETPGIDHQETDIYTKIQTIERIIEEDIGMPNLNFHFNLHEFEGLLFSLPEAFEMITEPEIVKKISQIRNDFDNPEYIDHGRDTAPSKRILQLIPSYAKVRYGTELSEYIGIERMRKECPHFDRWIREIAETPEKI